MTRLRILLADDHPVVLAGIRALVEGEPDMQVVAAAVNGAEAIRLADLQCPDVAVLDMSMPDVNGAEVADRIGRRCQQCRIVMLTVHDDRAYVRRLLEVGVAGYVLKRSAPAELVRAIRTAAGGGLYLDPAIAALAVGRAAPRSLPSAAAEVADLTERETAVLRLTAAGHGNKAIALALGIAVKTVEAHKANGMDRLGFHSRVELVRYAASRGWLEPL
ncbi:response regulator transcription factor [Dankookia rubra]|uniref:Response regulator transcription factor n=1 Tax=Dankookia rubra TaxID=1442381 RepID=A0A4R5Q896_9PROT|nr:response regulator transcription factor [Dankookia rubra]TDH59164.1 response regulator transcription factor [Dankookia rubra]